MSYKNAVMNASLRPENTDVQSAALIAMEWNKDNAEVIAAIKAERKAYLDSCDYAAFNS